MQGVATTSRAEGEHPKEEQTGKGTPFPKAEIQSSLERLWLGFWWQKSLRVATGCSWYPLGCYPLGYLEDLLKGK